MKTTMRFEQAATLRWAVLLLLSVAGGCDDAPTEHSPGAGVSQGPVYSQSGPGPYTGVLGIANRLDPSDSLVDLPTYPTQTLVQIQVAGLTYVYWNWPASQYGQLETRLNARGRSTGGLCREGIVIRYQFYSQVNWKPNPCGPDTTAVLSGFFLFQGTGKALRTGRAWQSGSACGGQPCRYYQGELLVSLTPVDASLALTASAETITTPTSVTFPTVVIPDTAGGLTVPRIAQGWRWLPDVSPGQTTPCNVPGTLVCTQTVYESGIMYADVLVNGTLKTAAARVRLVPPGASIDVVCTPGAPVRGAEISCEASASGGGALTITDWRFISASGEMVVREQQVGMTTWSGQLVADGVVEVTGTVDGQAASGSAAVSVTPRDWTNKAVPSEHSAPGQGPLDPHPTRMEGQLGKSELGLQRRQGVENPHVELVGDGGPNDGFFYLTDVPFYTQTLAYVNYDALQSGSDFFNLQYAQDTTIGGVRWCGQPFVTGVVPLIEAHEGVTPASQPNSHIGIFARHVQDVTGPQVEPIVGFGFDLEPPRAGIYAEAFADSWAMDYDARNNLNPTTLPCRFRYF
jgi:hypothetical protein